MEWLWFIIGIGVVTTCVAGFFWKIGDAHYESYMERWRKDNARYPIIYTKPDSRFWQSGWCVVAVLLLLVPTVLAFVVGAVIVDRSVSARMCDKKDNLSSASYEWVDYHFFSYECLMVTPSGNITDTPVLPLEDVTNRGER